MKNEIKLETIALLLQLREVVNSKAEFDRIERQLAVLNRLQAPLALAVGA